MSGSSWLDQALAAFVAAGGRGPDGLEHFCRACTEALTVDGAAVAMFADAGRDLVCATDETVALLDETQYTLGEGPFITAQTADAPVLVPDLTAAGGARWPAFLPSALQLGVQALFAFPLRLGAVRIGTLAFYRATSGSLARADLASALRAADLAAWMLIEDRTGRPPDIETHGWDRTSWASSELHQATGMVMVQLGINAGEAFARLRAFAFAHERRVSEVAADVVAGRLRLDEPEEDSLI